MDIQKDDSVEKRREYQRVYKRKRRAEEKLAKLGGKAPNTISGVKKITRKKTSVHLPEYLDDLPPLDQVHRIGYQAGVEALTKVAAAIGEIQPEGLSVLEIQRLSNVANQLITSCAVAGAEETEEEQIVMTRDVVQDESKIHHVHALLIAGVEDQEILSLGSDVEEGVQSP